MGVAELDVVNDLDLGEPFVKMTSEGWEHFVAAEQVVPQERNPLAREIIETGREPLRAEPSRGTGPYNILGRRHVHHTNESVVAPAGDVLPR